MEFWKWPRTLERTRECPPRANHGDCARLPRQPPPPAIRQTLIAFPQCGWSSWLDIGIGFEACVVLRKPVIERRLACAELLVVFQFGALFFFQIGQLQPGHAEHRSFEGTANQLAADTDSGKVCFAWNVT